MTPLERLSILSASGITGDSKVYEAYLDLMQRKWKISSKFDEYLPRKSYGENPDLILLEFFVEGSHHWFTIPDAIKMGRYGAKDKSIGIKIPMLLNISQAVLTNDVKKVNIFLMETFTMVGELIATNKILAKLDFDSKKFNQDYQVFMQHLLDDSP